ncbi:MAG: SMC-Scp complex subunit ScpB [Candidatus Buchananbacteria bacterium RIFCSPHIGHO2_02_FULL_40_13]|uniref:SMC-Scp complex subunit ScpB n=1 Tax=Candidatus Buchananbacteria bacterium RIFCSPLOWO2_01_FULL_39_33 TaxID=1797543 RepID=A0A1G1YNQ7_9BACT|nr:MAG: SMC-Scp complex subunit ScpB [Candidatus Buchananbacteria bacterium RIFCSPHIGHO2_01_FULL_40_35]OGY50596.1 MAG: SMC-Scp complex subunit ScpB [Candidatus Buchananbacteria bacterium RIFCSPHIGHO2_02_FULL_40_13]OGY53067.1 MAG: SMC-Scp complex subunit ScpB [Candidatus Buchananbacteria bacterium RIFCSPLOWO2_01_FULL_39_33]
MVLKNQIESLLFISPKPLSVKDLTKLMSADQKDTFDALIELAKEYQARASGIKLLKIGDKYQLTTAGEAAEVVKKFIKSEISDELTKPALETLTIIAYRGPISKAELEIIRGVNCSLILRNLLMRGLIEAGEDRKKMVVLYNITFEFLKYLGLNQLSDLPDFEKLNRNNNLDKLLAANQENNSKLEEN